MIKVDDNCPCGSLKCYTHCCHRYHGGDEFAPTAECLMRSRYSAFVIQNIDYIVQTTLPALQPLLDVAALKAWAEQTWWTYLKIISTTPKIGKRHAQVHFCAYFEELGVQGVIMSVRHLLKSMKMDKIGGIFLIRHCQSL